MIQSAPPATTPNATQLEPSQTGERLIVQIGYPSVDLLNQVAAELDVWEVDRKAQTLVAYVTLEQYEELLAKKLPVVLDCVKMRQYAKAVNSTLPTIDDLMREQCP